MVQQTIQVRDGIMIHVNISVKNIVKKEIYYIWNSGILCVGIVSI